MLRFIGESSQERIGLDYLVRRSYKLFQDKFRIAEVAKGNE
jgi:hypothetical protein